MNLGQAAVLVSNYNGGDTFHMDFLYSFENTLEYRTIITLKMFKC